MGAPPTPDEVIKDAILRDLDTGFTHLVVAYQPGIYSGALRLTGTREDAEDVAQDTFLRAYRALEGYDATRIGDMRFRPWLWTIALNLCRTRASRGRPTIALTEDHLAPSIDPGPIDDSAWNAWLAELPRTQRTAVILRHVLDLPIAEIAEVTHRPAGTVKADVSRGLARLRTRIDQEEAP